MQLLKKPDLMFGDVLGIPGRMLQKVLQEQLKFSKYFMIEIVDIFTEFFIEFYSRMLPKI